MSGDHSCLHQSLTIHPAFRCDIHPPRHSTNHGSRRRRTGEIRKKQIENMEKSVNQIKSENESPDEQEKNEKETQNISFIEETKADTDQKYATNTSTNPKKCSDEISNDKQEQKIISSKIGERNKDEKGLNEESQKTNEIVIKEKSEQLENPSREVKIKKNEIDSNFNEKSNNEQDTKGKNRKTGNKVHQKNSGGESIKKQNTESPKKSKKSKLKSDQVGKETSKDKQSKQTEIEVGRRRCESESLEQKRSNKTRKGQQSLKKMYSMDQTATPASPGSQRKSSLGDSDPQLSMWSGELNALNYVEGIRRGIDSKKLPPPPPPLQPAQQTIPSQQQMKGGSISNDTTKRFEVTSDRQHAIQGESSSMNQGSCPLYFGVKSYLHHFYGSIDEKLIRDNVDDFEYMIGPSGEKELHLIGNYTERGCHCGTRACRRFWLRAGLWGGANFLLVGLIALLVGYLTPPRATLVAYQDNIEIVDHWAMIFNKRLEVCRLAGLAVFCTGGLVLLIGLLAFTFCSECPRCHREKPENLDPHLPIVINSVRIPINEQIRSVQPTSGQSASFIVIQ